ncbi:MAG: alpha-hydroxy-acid oxidizing protein [Acidisphaera sp.]|nr:alpha-hydroxy-acid oxidizing protein [Acidisphaera sp.]
MNQIGNRTGLPWQKRNMGDDEYLVIHEFIERARNNLNRNVWDYLIGGSETETSLARNRMALDSVALRHRVLVDVSHIDATSEFFGRAVRLPIALAPVGSLESFEAGGGGTVARAASEFGIPFFCSSVTKPGLEAIAAAGAGPKVFQLYVRGDDAFVDDHVRRAVDAGYDAFCITVDTARYSRRERDLTKRFRKYWNNQVGVDFQAALSWKQIERFKAKHAIKLIIKGIGTAEDALQAVSVGVDSIYVSNHGGRQLDHCRGSFDVLAEVVPAVSGRAHIMVDGGFYRGTDIIKGIAMGADTIAIGRLYLYGLAANGAAGIVRLLELLEHEVEQSMGLTGVSSLAQLDRSYLHSAQPVVPPTVHSAFPHLHLPKEIY